MNIFIIFIKRYQDLHITVILGRRRQNLIFKTVLEKHLLNSRLSLLRDNSFGNFPIFLSSGTTPMTHPKLTSVYNKNIGTYILTFRSTIYRSKALFYCNLKINIQLTNNFPVFFSSSSRHPLPIFLGRGPDIKSSLDFIFSILSIQISQIKL